MSDPTLSIDTDLRLVRRAYREARRSGCSRIDAERAVLDTYCSLHPEVPEAEAGETVARLLKASSEAGLIWIDN